MSLINTHNPIPDGYATIRRGFPRRSKSQREQLRTRSFKSLVIKTNDMQESLNHDSDTKKCSDNTFTQLNSIKDNNNIFNGVSSSSSSSKTCQTLKPIQRHGRSISEEQLNGNLTDSLECLEEAIPYDYILPPLKSPQYINELNSIRSKTADNISISSHQQISLYARPESPIYGINRIGQNYDSFRISSDHIEPVPPSPTYVNLQSFRKPIVPISEYVPKKYKNHTKEKNYEEIDKSVFKKPPIKSATLQHQRSYNPPKRSSSIYSEPTIQRQHSDGINRTHHVNNNLSSSDISDISSEGYTRFTFNKNGSADFTSLDYTIGHMPLNNVHNYRHYATLGYSKDTKYNQGKSFGKSTGSLNEAQLDYFDALDCKVGCQTTLRSKPRIPWYELAIKKDHRQSCPPFQEEKVIILKLDFFKSMNY